MGPERRILHLIFILLASALASAPAGAEVRRPAVEHSVAVEAARAGDYATALPMLEALVEAQPKVMKYRYDLIVVRSWAELHNAALYAAKGLPLRRLPEYVLAAVARSARLAGQRDQSVAAYRELLRRKPRSTEYRQGLDLAMAPSPEPVSPPPPPPAPPEDPADVGAREIRAAARALNGSWSPQRYRALDDALAASDRRIAEARTAGATARLRRLQLDRIEALVMRGHHAEAVALAQTLEAEGTLPAYLAALLGDAHSRLRQPEAAVRRYREALAADPERIAWLQALYFAELEAEHHDAADAVIRRLGDLTAAGSEAARRDAAILAARAALYANRHGLAQSRIDAVLAEAPDNAGALQTAASVAAARGLPRKAEGIYRRLLAVRPDDIDARIGLVGALRGVGDRLAADPLADELMATAPEHPGVRRLARDMDVVRRAELDSRVEAGKGAGSVVGNKDLTWHTYLYSAPIASQWRVFAHHLQMASDFDGGTPRHERVGMGLEYTARDWGVVGEVGQALNNGRDPTMSLSAAWSPTDHWAIRAGVEHNTDDVPLKGRNDTFQTLADRYSASVSYQWHESRSVSLGVTHHDFNDGNRRTALSLGVTQRVTSGPNHRVDLSADAYTSQGERVDVFYYNPKRDVAVSVGASAHLTGWRRYDHFMTHELSAFVGQYRQSAFGRPGAPDPTYGWNVFHGVRYGHRWQLGPALAIDYGLGVRMFPYDGAQEHRKYAYAGVNWRF